MNTLLSINLIMTNPDVRGGRPCIVGTGVRVLDVVIAHRYHERTPAQIAEDYEISIAAVYAALAYYYEHQAIIDEDILAQTETVEQAKERWIADGGTPLLS